MSKKIQGVGFDSYVLVGHEDSRSSFKHQTLLQDYHELQKETEAARSKLEAMKLKKLTLQAQVRFLRRRHAFLVKNKSLSLRKPAIIDRRFAEGGRHRKSTNEKMHLKKEAAWQNIDQTAKIKSFDVVGLDKDVVVKTRVPTFDLNQKSREEEEEEELQEVYEPNNLVRSVDEEKLNELKLSMCRNVSRGASMGQDRKRKISLQDPVVLRLRSMKV